MADNTSDFVREINSLIDISKNADEGFKGAAANVDDPKLKTMFLEYADQRAGFVQELQSAVSLAGGKADDPSGIGGKLHRGWMAVKTTFTTNDEHQILAECERGEDLSVKAYRDALAKNLPTQLRTIVQRQYEQVELAHNRIRELRDQTGGKTRTGTGR
jgi:uncharacterized protein (TIGR02284 family)